ncbi:MAG: glutamate racemase [Planctomycetota bacterium]|jgi:glutamate racemase|nr:glutamate racemase [Planctomycetota bacterium]
MIGVFDSGIGGLSVLREIRRELPRERLRYFADTARMPYGERDFAEILILARRITQFLLARGVKIVVIACNTATAAALYPLRREFPQTLFVGMEPAIKPAAAKTRAGKIGILATPGTLRGAPYAGVVERFAGGVKIFEQVCPALATMIENGAADELRPALEKWLAPLRAAGVDQLVLACTHYPLIAPLIREVAGRSINLIDPAPAIARQVKRLLAANHWSEAGGIEYYVSARAEATAAQIRQIMGDAAAEVILSDDG